MSTPPAFDTFLAIRKIASNTLFQPLLTGPLLAYALRLTPQIPATLFPKLLDAVAPYIERSKATAVLAVLFALGSLGTASRILTERKNNNFVSDTYDWSKEIVVVTGGSSGIGELVCKDLQRRGIVLVILDVNAPEYKLASTSHFFKCDLAKPAQIGQVCEEIRTSVGHPTVLFNNAGIGSGKTILETPGAEYERMFAINTISHFHLVREFLPAMVARDHGHVLCTASMASFLTIAWNVSYSQVKVSALAFHEGLTQEIRHVYGAPRIRTTIFHPTWVQTPLIAHVTQLKGWKETTLPADVVAKAMVARILSGRSGGRVCLPEGYEGAAGVRGFPGFVQEHMRDTGAKIGRVIKDEGGGFEVPKEKYQFDD